MKSFAIMLLLTAALLAQAAYADVIMPGQKPVSWCYELANAADYPDYAFVLNAPPVSEIMIIRAGECFSFYKNAHGTIYAVEKSDFDESEITEMGPEKAEEYFSNPKFIRSSVELQPSRTVPENDPLSAVKTELRITSLSANSLEIEKSKVIYTYSDGSSEEKMFASQDSTPKPSKKALMPWWFSRFWYAILPFAAIIAIAAILIARKLRK